jgi:adenylosuccinate synthase
VPEDQVNRRIVLLSGHVGTGKSTLADGLVQRFGGLHLRTSQLLSQQLENETDLDRRRLQEAGDALDRRTSGTWVRSALLRELRDSEDEGLVFVDAVRIQRQIEAIRNTFGSRVTHVHLTAPKRTLSKRYRERSRQSGKSPNGGVRELASFDEVLVSATERQVESLEAYADIVVDSQRSTKLDVQIRVASYLGLYGPRDARLVDILVGGQYGSEGKGHIAATLAPEYGLLVRVGGPNAGHTVCLEAGETYTHHQLPSGTLSSSAKLLLAPGSVLRVPSLMREIAECSVEVDRLSIDPQAMIISDDDILGEEEGVLGDIGSTKQGVGYATARRIRERGGQVQLARDIPELRPYICPAREILDDALCRGEKIMVEGTQGTSLSIYHGYYPHVTSRDTTAAGCLAEAGLPPTRVRRVVMVCRTFPIRVQSPAGGTSGYMSQELRLSDIARRSGLNSDALRKAEKTSTTGRDRRIAEFDWDQLRQSASLNGPTDIALTFADYISSRNGMAKRVDQLTVETIRFIEDIERVAGAPVSLISTGFHLRSVIDRRNW